MQVSKRALLIGINYFGTINELNGSINDINQMRNILVEQFEYNSSNIITLTDDKSGILRPTKQNILTNIQKLVKLTKPNDVLYIHYCGHSSNNDIILPVDHLVNDNISKNEFKNILINRLPKGSRLRCFFDCCTNLSILPYHNLNNAVLCDNSKIINNDNCVIIYGYANSLIKMNDTVSQYNGPLTLEYIKALKTINKIQTSWKHLLMVIRHLLIIDNYTQIPIMEFGNAEIIKNDIDI
jgi:hypothetical protein